MWPELMLSRAGDMVKLAPLEVSMPRGGTGGEEGRLEDICLTAVGAQETAGEM